MGSATPEDLADRVLKVVAQVTGADQVRQDLDLRLFDFDLLDSFAVVELVVALGEEFGVEIGLGDVERADFASPRSVIGFMERRYR